MKKLVIVLLSLNVIAFIFFLKSRQETRITLPVASSDKPVTTRSKVIGVNSRLLTDHQTISQEDFDYLLETIKTSNSLSDKAVILDSSLALNNLIIVKSFTEPQKARLVEMLKVEFKRNEAMQKIAKTSPDPVYKKIPDRSLRYCIYLAGRTDNRQLVPVLLSYQTYPNRLIQENTKKALASLGYTN